ncbi:YeeE/YedE family protein [Chromobacterium subtsugae]|uniref:YeeE/YedE family protein n=1 Tax=Chromobacterium subtsugae TaxID=251747 RepID=A0ABS7F8D4_9NEIS|nr:MULTISPECIES: YeeE/YedE family protein [Chromobacterium]KUM02833.1 YeeE/YedE [Chromobacterium subtsugae]KZE83283.1 YeeE/YedE [Chromobacterium sp. F49]MBW7567252.1 YeeE/YedE family protein [Chromobacterium subtsugae]MBW8286222.1 YeeE/YedE family protein [Chromobacterium subtsugae]OBU87873.1 YeeE/YedE [Chromobacterium subtsugae]
MQLDWSHFTPWSALAGGMLIGLAAAWLILLNGRVAGISGIVGQLLSPGGDKGWRLAFVAGLVLSPWAYRLCAAPPAIALDHRPWLLIAAGLLVGFGSRLGSGCTSGHGVCGLARLSPRSLAATLAFMAAGFAVVWLMRDGGVL